MNLQLTIIDRIKLINLLPKQGTFVEMIHADAIGRMIEIKSDEAELIGLKTEEENGATTIKWDVSKESLLEVELNKPQCEVIDNCFKSLEKSKEVVDLGLINLYNKWKQKT